MLSRSAFLRVTLLLVAAAIVAGLIQSYLPASMREPDPDPAISAQQSAPKPAAAPRRSEPPPPVAKTDASPTPDAKTDASPTPDAPSADRAPVASSAEIAPAPAETPAPVQEAPAAIEAVPLPTVPLADESVAVADRNADPRAVDLVDLNTATLAQLNGLKGGGAIGRTIIQHRPYASVDQLLSKRVLNRATYQRIKDQVTAR